jgi:hypothetical protein
MVEYQLGKIKVNDLFSIIFDLAVKANQDVESMLRLAGHDLGVDAFFGERTPVRGIKPIRYFVPDVGVNAVAGLGPAAAGAQACSH